MELGYCQACGTRNGPEAAKCGKCGTEIINLDRSSNALQGIRSGAVAGVIIGIVCAIWTAMWGMLFSGSIQVGFIIVILVSFFWVIKGVITGAIAGVTGSLCYYKNASSIGLAVAIVLYLVTFGLFSSGSIIIEAILGGSLGSLASYIERKYFRKMTWL